MQHAKFCYGFPSIFHLFHLFKYCIFFSSQRFYFNTFCKLFLGHNEKPFTKVFQPLENIVITEDAANKFSSIPHVGTNILLVNVIMPKIPYMLSLKLMPNAYLFKSEIY